jgi:hypothetical protein
MKNQPQRRFYRVWITGQKDTSRHVIAGDMTSAKLAVAAPLGLKSIAMNGVRLNRLEATCATASGAVWLDTLVAAAA